MTSHSIQFLGVRTPACQMPAMELRDMEDGQNSFAHKAWKRQIRRGLPTKPVPAVEFMLSKPPLLLGPGESGKGLEAPTAELRHEWRPATPQLPIKERALAATAKPGPPREPSLPFVAELQSILDGLIKNLDKESERDRLALFPENSKPQPVNTQSETKQSH